MYQAELYSSQHLIHTVAFVNKLAHDSDLVSAIIDSLVLCYKYIFLGTWTSQCSNNVYIMP